MQPHLVLSTPAYGKQVYQAHMQSVLRLIPTAQERGVRLSYNSISDSIITRARDNLVAEFLNDETATHLLWIDADIDFQPDQVWRLFNYPADVTIAAYPFKHYFLREPKELQQFSPYGAYQHSMEYVLNVVPEATVDEHGFIEVFDGATGFMLIRREVFLKMIEAYPELRYETDMQGASKTNQFLFFSEMIEETERGRRRLSEDYAFCRRWQRLGGKIFLDTQSKLTHIGPHEFQGDLGAKIQCNQLLQRASQEPVVLAPPSKLTPPMVKKSRRRKAA